jgi:hypothetical protein
MGRGAVLFLLPVLAWTQSERLEDTLYIPLDSPAIRYTQAPDDPVAHLDKRLESGQAKLGYSADGLGYLPSVLRLLGINTDSQALVFSKTSIQQSHINPRTPRALYFNDEVSVGFVQGGDVLELTSLDPKLGIILYTLDTEKADKPQFSRRDDCLKCHQGPVTLGVPGLLVSSVHPRSSGPGEGHGSSYMTDDRVPIDERWGGWYVTGSTGTQKHYGNNPNLVDPLQPGGPAGPESQNVTDLSAFFDTSRYAAPTSDIVALMTLEHQTRMTNLLTRVGWDARIDPRNPKLNGEIEEMLRYMLFTEAAPLKSPIAGVSTFTKTFPERGPRDHRGRSLRDFDLKTRLFQYPLSYMIYSTAFDNLPAAARDRVYQRLYEILSGKDQTKPFASLSTADRRSILEIVRDTKPGLPAYWKS